MTEVDETSEIDASLGPGMQPDACLLHWISKSYSQFQGAIDLDHAPLDRLCPVDAAGFGRADDNKAGEPLRSTVQGL